MIMKKILSISIFSVLLSGTVLAQDIDVTGTVKDENGSPMPSATVEVREKGVITFTDTLGFFRVSAKPNFTLVVSGRKFVSGAVVSFGGTFLPTQFVSSTELIATGTAIAGQAGKVEVTVINPDPGSATSNQFALQVGNQANALSATAAARLLEQSTWGVNPLTLSHVQAVGMQAFLNEQFAMAPSTFGKFANKLLVGNFGDGTINVFDPTSGALQGTISNNDGTPIVVDGLWALQFGNGIDSQPTSTLFYTAGPDDETHGLYGRIDLN